MEAVAQSSSDDESDDVLGGESGHGAPLEGGWDTRREASRTATGGGAGQTLLRGAGSERAPGGAGGGGEPSASSSSLLLSQASSTVLCDSIDQPRLSGGRSPHAASSWRGLPPSAAPSTPPSTSLEDPCSRA